MQLELGRSQEVNLSSPSTNDDMDKYLPTVSCKKRKFNLLENLIYQIINLRTVALRN